MNIEIKYFYPDMVTLSHPPIFASDQSHEKDEGR